MIAASAPVKSGSLPAPRRPGLGAARLVRLELRHNAMLWLLPVTFAVFWYVSYRKMNVLPPLWNVRANDFQQGVVASFIVPVTGAGAWMGARERRRHVTDQTTITARPRWVRLLATWAATAIWALVGWLICLAVVYGVTAHLATWGGPLWWPAVVAAASVVAFSALGFTAGALLPGRLTPPAIAIASFFVLALSSELISGGQSYWQISPIVAGPWESSQDPGVATFYPYVPDLSIAQVMFLAGLTVAVLGAVGAPYSGRRARSVAAAVAAAGVLAAGTAVNLAGTGRLDAYGMITIPALHDAGSNRPLRFTPDCSRTPIPVCVNPAYAPYLPAVAAALRPMLAEIAGLPGAPVRISQAAASYEQGSGNSMVIGLAGKQLLDGEFRTLLPDQSNGGPMTISQLAEQVRVTTGSAIVASFVGDGPGASQAQQAVAAGLSMDAGLPAGIDYVGPPIPRGGHVHNSCVSRSAACAAHGTGRLAASSALTAATRRFAALPLATRRAWLAQHLTALRAGQITLEQLP